MCGRPRAFASPPYTAIRTPSSPYFGVWCLAGFFFFAAVFFAASFFVGGLQAVRLLLVCVWLIYFRYPFPIKIDFWPLTGYMARKVIYTYQGDMK
jgi:hypothetical protein